MTEFKNTLIKIRIHSPDKDKNEMKRLIGIYVLIYGLIGTE